MTEWKNPLKDEWDPKIEWDKKCTMKIIKSSIQRHLNYGANEECE